MGIQLRLVTFLNAVTAAGPSTVEACDYRFGDFQNRNIFVTVMNAADTIAVQTSPDGGTTWLNIAALTGATSGVMTISGPYALLRIAKSGATGPATVYGIV